MKLQVKNETMFKDGLVKVDLFVTWLYIYKKKKTLLGNSLSTL